jgi:hypothetical protein
MFKPNEIEAMPLVLEGYFKDLENRIMEDIVRRIKINSEITSTADLQMQRLSEMGASKKAIKDYIQQALQLSEQGIDDLYNGAIQKGYNSDRDLYTATGRDFIPYAENQQLQQLVEAVKKQTNSDIKNITQSMGFAVRQPDGRLTFQPIADYYQKTLDKAVLDITSGSFDYNTVLKRTVQEMTDSGLRWIDYASGHHNRVPVAVRRAVMTGVNQVTAKITEQNMELLQTEYVEVSWHRGARPSHQVWQGKIYHWKEKAISRQTETTHPKNSHVNQENNLTFTENNNIIKMSSISDFVPDWSQIQPRQDAESVFECKKYAIEELGIPADRINFDKILNGDALQPFLKQLKILKEKTGVIPPSIIAVPKIDGDESCVACVKPTENNFYISSNFFNNKELFEQILKSWAANGIMPKECRSIAFVAKHEHGHLRTLALCETQEAKDIYTAYTKACKKQSKRFISNNDYNIYEFFADCVAIAETTKKTTIDVEKVMALVEKYEKGEIKL